MHKYGATQSEIAEEQRPLSPSRAIPHRSSLQSFTSLKDVASRVAFLDGTKSHHHPHHTQADVNEKCAALDMSPLQIPPLSTRSDSDDLDSNEHDTPNNNKVFFSHTNLRKLALDLSLWINIFILLTKTVAYLETLSLSILAALVDSILDVVSQWILAYTEKRSSKTRSSAHYPAGAS